MHQGLPLLGTPNPQLLRRPNSQNTLLACWELTNQEALHASPTWHPVAQEAGREHPRVIHDEEIPGRKQVVEV
jgi:hypothetical protein